MLKKILGLVGVYMLTQFMGQSAMPRRAYEMSAGAVKRLGVSIWLFVGAMVIAAGGYFLILADFIFTTRDLGEMALSQISIVGGVLLVIGMVMATVAVQRPLIARRRNVRDRWSERQRAQEAAAMGGSFAPLTAAVTALIHDHIDERKARRNASFSRDEMARERYEERTSEPPPVYM